MDISQSQPQKSDKPQGKTKSVTIHDDGAGKFHVFGEGQRKEHADINAALEHARSIFSGSEAGSEDTAMEASGAGGSL